MYASWNRSAAVALALLLPVAAAGQPVPAGGEECTVQVLNQSVRVQADRTWLIQNIPDLGGWVKANLTCTGPAGTRQGQSTFFPIEAGTMSAIPSIPLAGVDAGPAKIVLTASKTSLVAGATSVDTAQLKVMGEYTGGPALDLTAAEAGTSFSTSRPEVAQVDNSGVLTVGGALSGAVLITAWNQGISATILVHLVNSTDPDGDGDGLPRQWEIAVGLNDANPLDALADVDGDGLIALDEYAQGTDPFDPDSDKDTLPDGAEPSVADGYATSPAMADTDGDAVPDDVEIAQGTDPTDPLSVDLTGAVVSLQVTPPAVTLQVGAFGGIKTVTVSVTGVLADGRGIDLTKHKSTQYTITDIQVAGFGGEPWELIGLQAGEVTFLTVAAAGKSVLVPVSVVNVDPQQLASLELPSAPWDVAVSGPWVAVASDAGVLLANVGVPASPVLTGQSGGGLARDVAFRPVSSFDPPRIVAARPASGLSVHDIVWAEFTLPCQGQNCTQTGERWELKAGPSLPLDGKAVGVAVSQGRALVALESAGKVALVEVPDPGPAPPTLLGLTAVPGVPAAVDLDGTLGAVVTSTHLALLDVSSAGAPVVKGTMALDPVDGGSSGPKYGGGRSVTLHGGTAYVARPGLGLLAIDVSTPGTPVAHPLYTMDGLLKDLAAVAVTGSHAFVAQSFGAIRQVPILDVAAPASPAYLFAVALSPSYVDSEETGIASDSSLFLVTVRSELPADHPHLLQIVRHGPPPATVLPGHPGVVDAAAPAVSFTYPEPLTIAYTGTPAASNAFVSLTATDDVAVAFVRVTVDDVLVATLKAAPYEAVVPLAGTGIHTIGAQAVDLAGNVSKVAEVYLSVQDPPKTTIVGLVQDTSGGAVPGALVVVQGQGLQGTAKADGSFSIASASGLNPASLLVLPAGMKDGKLFGPFVPVPDGSTDVGVLVVDLNVVDTSGTLVAPIVARPVVVNITEPPLPAGAVSWTEEFTTRDYAATGTNSLDAFIVPSLGHLRGALFPIPSLGMGALGPLVVPKGEVKSISITEAYESITVYGHLTILGYQGAWQFWGDMGIPGDFIVDGGSVTTDLTSLSVGGVLSIKPGDPGTGAPQAFMSGDLRLTAGLLEPGAHAVGVPFTAAATWNAGAPRVSIAVDGDLTVSAPFKGQLAATGDLLTGDVTVAVLDTLRWGGIQVLGSATLGDVSGELDVVVGAGAALHAGAVVGKAVTLQAGGDVVLEKGAWTLPDSGYGALSVVAGGAVAAPARPPGVSLGSLSTGGVTVAAGGTVTVASIASGDALGYYGSGNVSVTAATLDGDGAQVRSGDAKVTSSGNVIVKVAEVRGDGLVVASGTSGNGDSGDVTVSASRVVHLTNSVVASGDAKGGSMTGSVALVSGGTVELAGTTVRSGTAACPWLNTTGSVTVRATDLLWLTDGPTLIGSGGLGAGLTCAPGPSGAVWALSGGALIVDPLAQGPIAIEPGAGSPKGTLTQEAGAVVPDVAVPAGGSAYVIQGLAGFRSTWIDTGASLPKYLFDDLVLANLPPGTSVQRQFTSSSSSAKATNDSSLLWKDSVSALLPLRYFAYTLSVKYFGSTSPAVDRLRVTWLPQSCTAGAKCFDGDPCTDDVCDPVQGCLYPKAQATPAGCP